MPVVSSDRQSGYSRAIAIVLLTSFTSSKGVAVTGVPVVILIVGAIMVLVVSSLAARKGYSVVGFGFFAVLVWPIALVAVMVLPARSEQVTVGSLIKVQAKIQLNDGGRIPQGHQAKVTAVDVIDGEAVVQISVPDGSKRWIAKSLTVPA